MGIMSSDRQSQSSNETASNEDKENPEDSESRQPRNDCGKEASSPGKLISQPLVAYVHFALQLSKRENIKSTATGHFTLQQTTWNVKYSAFMAISCLPV